jgi:hypothetical protein
MLAALDTMTKCLQWNTPRHLSKTASRELKKAEWTLIILANKTSSQFRRRVYSLTGNASSMTA